MRRYCDQFEAYLAGELETLPEAVRAHAARCARCQRALQLEQAYRRVVGAVRETPVPATTLAWERIQAQLNARAAVRTRPIVWRYAPAFGLTAMAFVGLSLLLLTRPLEPTPDSATPAPKATSPALKHALPLGTRLLDYSTQLTGRPSAPVSTRPRIAGSASLGTPQTRRITHPPHAARTRIVKPLPKRGNNGSARLIARQSSTDKPALFIAGVPKVESPPLSQFEVASATEVDYLPLQYEMPAEQSSESGDSEHAMVGSF